jgi:hypothetical protein
MPTDFSYLEVASDLLPSVVWDTLGTNRRSSHNANLSQGGWGEDECKMKNSRDIL